MTLLNNSYYLSESMGQETASQLLKSQGNKKVASTALSLSGFQTVQEFYNASLSFSMLFSLLYFSIYTLVSNTFIVSLNEATDLSRTELPGNSQHPHFRLQQRTISSHQQVVYMLPASFWSCTQTYQILHLELETLHVSPHTDMVCSITASPDSPDGFHWLMP